MKSLKILLASSLFIVFSGLMSCQAQSNKGYTATFPLNQYLQTSSGSPYPSLVQDRVNALKSGTFISVMNFGAKGNGLVADDAAIAAAFAACKKGTGVLFPSGKTFLIKNLIQIPIKNDITVLAEGATFKMADNTGYNAIALESQGEGYVNTIVWLGGTWDGNKDRQAWPGSPTKNDNWTVTQGNYGLLTIKRAKFALVKNVHLLNTVYDGIDLHECKLGVIADSDAAGGAALNYGALRTKYGQGRQSTYFKSTRTKSEAVYFMNLICKGGSIGVQYSTEDTNPASLSVVTNCQFYNQAQDAMHFEHCVKVFISKCSIYDDNAEDYRGDIHLSNASELVSIKDTKFHNGKVDFRNAKNLKVGAVENSTFEYSDANIKDRSLPPSLNSFVFNATHVNNCTFKGRTTEAQVKADNVSQSDFEDFNVALKVIKGGTSNKFKNGSTAVEGGKGGVALDNSTFSNVSNSTDNSGNDNFGKARGAKMKGHGKGAKASREVFSSSSAPFSASIKAPITIVDESNKTLGVL